MVALFLSPVALQQTGFFRTEMICAAKQILLARESKIFAGCTVLMWGTAPPSGGAERRGSGGNKCSMGVKGIIEHILQDCYRQKDQLYPDFSFGYADLDSHYPSATLICHLTFDFLLIILYFFLCCD